MEGGKAVNEGEGGKGKEGEVVNGGRELVKWKEGRR